jgi:hypothetical protein
LRSEDRKLVEEARFADAGLTPYHCGGAGAGTGVPVQLVEML